MAKKRSLIQRMPLGPVIAAMFGLGAVALVAATPQWLFESTVASSGIGKVLSVAQPPLGIKARLLAIFFALAVAALIGWVVGSAVERLLFGPSAPKPVVEHDDDDDDALDLGHYAQPLPAAQRPRGPIFADRELGAPLMSDEALATGALLAEPFPPFDPAPFLDEPAEDPLFAEPMDEAAAPPRFADLVEPEPVAFEPDVATDPVLQAPLVIEEFDVPVAAEEPEILPGESSIDALIRRLEAGLARRAGPQPPTPGAPAVAPAAAEPRDWLIRDRDASSFDEDTTRALGTLRRMAG
jgi:hypothetical protein